MTTISDDDIFENLKLLKEKVNGINIKTKETILSTSENKKSSIDLPIIDISNIKTYILYFVYFCVPIIISGLIVYLLIYLKSDIVLTETKIDNFLIKTEISYYKVIVTSLTICVVMYLLTFLIHKNFF